jgi:uncharacterized protein YlxW (UPF0749 family)
MNFVNNNWETIEYLIPVFYILIVSTVSIIFSKNIQNNHNRKNDKSRPRDRHDISETQEQKFDLDDKIRDLNIEAAKYNTPETFVKHSKIQRQVIKLQRQANKLAEQITQDGGIAQESELDKSRL